MLAINRRIFMLTTREKNPIKNPFTTPNSPTPSNKNGISSAASDMLPGLVSVIKQRQSNKATDPTARLLNIGLLRIRKMIPISGIIVAYCTSNMEPRRQNRSIKNYCIALAVLRLLTDRSRNESDIGFPGRRVFVSFCFVTYPFMLLRIIIYVNDKVLLFSTCIDVTVD